MLSFLTSLLPAFGALLTGVLLLYAIYARWVDAPTKLVLDHRLLAGLWAVALLALAGSAALWLLQARADEARHEAAARRASRARFVLTGDMPYGELQIPAGTLVNRDDPYDTGEPGAAVSLRGLVALRFPQPVQVAGVWASALQAVPARMELAQTQRIGPLYRYNATAERWEVNPAVPALVCARGQIALFDVPHIPYDALAEAGRPPPDGAAARFAPSQWLFRGCEAGPPIMVLPAAGTANAR